MRRILLIVVAAALAAVPSGAALLELAAPEAVPSAPSAMAAAGAFAAPLSASPAGFSAVLSAAVPAPAPLSSPAVLAVPSAVSPAPPPALAPARRAGARPTLLKTATAPLPDLSGLGEGESSAAAAADFERRTQLDGDAAAPASVPAPSESSWSRFRARLAGRPAAAERAMAETVIPRWMETELPVASGKLGQELTDGQKSSILKRSKVWVYAWHSGWTYEISGGLPDGHYDPKFGIRVMLKNNWRRLKDPENHFRVLYAHEYTHWLQEEGKVTRRMGGEIPAVAVELLRAMELVGWEGMKAGRIGFIAEGTLGAFEDGRRWARGDMADATALMFRGVLGGAAYEVGVQAGRPEAAWEFLNLVIAEKGGMKPREARAFVLSGATRAAER
ncbi:MAG: hypothetical protein KGL74_01840 [Elusimicrobia bacterium]|nr:hypothetical protein [Elusimicrobiota bacterium]